MTTRTNVVLDDELVAKAMARAGVTTKRAAVEAALRAFVRTPDYSGLLALAGTGVIAEDYDPKALLADSPHSIAEPGTSSVQVRDASKARAKTKAKGAGKPAKRSA